eukprot:scaffold28414_cov26-Tisochrysis_lutea.AAC.1
MLLDEGCSTKFPLSCQGGCAMKGANEGCATLNCLSAVKQAWAGKKVAQQGSTKRILNLLGCQKGCTMEKFQNIQGRAVVKESLYGTYLKIKAALLCMECWLMRSYINVHCRGAGTSEAEHALNLYNRAAHSASAS